MFKHLPNCIVYVRHPQCLHNIAADDALKSGIENRKSPLTKRGEEQRDITSDYLKQNFGEFDIVFASTYDRTSTIPVALQLAKPFLVSALLDERSMGIWHKKPRSEVLDMFPGEEDKVKKEGYYYYVAPEGESCPDVERRQITFLSNTELFTGATTALISGHGIAGLCFKRMLLGASVVEWHAWDRLKNASVTVYDKNEDGFRCTLYNHVPWEGKIEDIKTSEA